MANFSTKLLALLASADSIYGLTYFKIIMKKQLKTVVSILLTPVS